MALHMTEVNDELGSFLLGARRRTYAAQNSSDRVPSLLADSTQFEFAQGDWYYRDLYFGVLRFTGIELVTYRGAAIWSMSYSGGIADESIAEEQSARVYDFLKRALRQDSVIAPSRGPKTYREGIYAYRNDANGSIERFHGHECITCNGEVAYELRCCGGNVQ
ncbi:MAG: DUF5680 domain-containing protein [Bifidobacterium tibiigranuli]|jgi:hypothetical protein|uniref:DUF5680 domain-containing protein n=1 Tax=Bifidobacterium tibiigranuli TaxID=2172043 RepID=UPI0026F1AD9A|nr:DUF5680 domain-containing protein [Bifidobacterium tibiigranuli]MCI1673867.1 DUF5680 domain-containing protein [Bifidobacterium tibiigranuli]MCI1712116.1 DUF5680 domain-containing protein [Bifidobacterium tibiigranuli]MCI1833825.1 DUF5680 domain-containing protein [Bifidobacterium tibiigranuli]